LTTQSIQTLQHEAARLRQQGRIDRAVDVYRRILDLDPGLADYWFDLAWMLRQLGQFDAALDAYDRALAAGVSGPEEVHLNKGVILTDELHQPDAAEAAYLAALAIRPDYLPALLNLGNLHEENADRETAIATYERLIEAGAGQADAKARNIVAEAQARRALILPKDRLPETELEALAALAQTPALSAEARANCAFALGRIRDRDGDVDAAFSAWTLANTQAATTGAAYDPRRGEAMMQALLSHVPQASAKEADTPPIFICGLFRSGSTLVERVLSAHGAIEQGGELDLLMRLAMTRFSPYPAGLERQSAQALNDAQAHYLASLDAKFPGVRATGRRVTDKWPDNYLFIGMILALFPGARIIHTVRDLRDVAISMYGQHLDQQACPYSSDLSAIGHHFGQYRRLMAGWKARYAAQIHDFNYDRFVSAPEEALRPLFEFLDLDWDPAVLDFHQRAGSVKTASYWQVRQPLYATSSGRWKAYERHLAPFLDALAAAGEAP